MSRFFNTHSNPNNGEYTIQNSSGHNGRESEYYVSWRRQKEYKGQAYQHGVMVRYGGLNPLECLLEQAGYVQAKDVETKQPDVDNDEFECEHCHRILDIEDSVKLNYEYLCPFCAEETLKERAKELVADETDSVSKRDW